MNRFGKQRTLAIMTGFERYTKKTRRAMFLEEIDMVRDGIYCQVRAEFSISRLLLPPLKSVWLQRLQ